MDIHGNYVTVAVAQFGFADHVWGVNDSLLFYSGFKCDGIAPDECTYFNPDTPQFKSASINSGELFACDMLS